MIMKTNDFKIKLNKRRLTKTGLKNMFRKEHYFNNITVKGEIDACNYVSNIDYMTDKNYLELSLIILNNMIDVDNTNKDSLRVLIIQTIEHLLDYSFVQIDLIIK